jgi:preprotein translocase subunit SecG
MAQPVFYAVFRNIQPRDKLVRWENVLPRSKWKEQAEYWKTMPASANVLVLAAIFCMFASFGLMNSILDLNTTVASAVVSAALMACFSAAIAFTAFRAMVKSTIAVIVLLVALSLLLGRSSGHHTSNSIENGAELQRRVRIESAMAMATIIAGYVFILMFLRKEGLRLWPSHRSKACQRGASCAGAVHRAPDWAI